MPGPLLILHQDTGQPHSCLAGLVAYAKEVAKTPQAQLLSEDELLDYLWLSPVVFDAGEGPTVAGCRPAQRSRVWPRDLNCWEATAHLTGWAIAQQLPIELHLFDAYLGKTRHVFPAWRAIGTTAAPVPLLLQPPVVGAPDALTQRNLVSLGVSRALRAGRAQAWYNTVADVAHGVGTVVLSVFGAGAVAPLVEEAWKLAPEEYGLSKYKKTATQPELDEARAATEVAKAATATAAVLAAQADKEADKADKRSTKGPPPPPANALIVPDGRGGYWNYGPPIC